LDVPWGRKEIREKWNIPDKATCFIFSGKFEEKKRPMDILRALHEIYRPSAISLQPSADSGQRTADNNKTQASAFSPAPRGDQLSPDSNKPQVSGLSLGEIIPHPSIHLLMVGDGVLKKECEAYAGDHILPVTFTGFLNQSELPEAYAATDCLVLPSDYGETWGLVVNEAMACGLPAIVSDHVGCHPDLVHPELTGEVFEFGNVTALADCMRRLASNPEHLRCMGRDARERISAYSIENLTQATIDAIKLLAHEKNR
jgi:glycosyltransferase involved in cell wall biosynthesis